MNLFEQSAIYISPILMGATIFFLKKYFHDEEDSKKKLNEKFEHLHAKLDDIRKDHSFTSKVQGETSVVLSEKIKSLKADVGVLIEAGKEHAKSLGLAQLDNKENWGRIIFIEQGQKRLDEHFKIMGKLIKNLYDQKKS